MFKQLTFENAKQQIVLPFKNCKKLIMNSPKTYFNGMYTYETNGIQCINTTSWDCFGQAVSDYNKRIITLYQLSFPLSEAGFRK